MTNINSPIWHWYHNVSECYYHIQITVKYRKALLDERVQAVIQESLAGIKERYAIEISHYGFDQNHLHILTQFLPTHSGGQVVRTIKSISAKRVFTQVPDIRKELWGSEFWTDGYYIATVSGHGNKKIIENYILNQGRQEDVRQLKLFNL
ncbi:MAG: IS200/IS605 family transposase [bacterium]|nr:IS200/IS605 family transposase [bacterium]